MSSANLTADPREGEYSGALDDDDWLERAHAWYWARHDDMLSFAPSDAALILWRAGSGRTRWLERATRYEAFVEGPSSFAPLIRARVAELDARFEGFGDPEEAGSPLGRGKVPA